MSAENHFLLAPYGQDPLARLSDFLLKKFPTAAPDLGRFVVLFPSTEPITRFHQILLSNAAKQGQSALLPPRTSALSTWIRQFADPDIPTLDAIERELLLVETLREFPKLSAQCGVWPLVDSICRLFDEFTLNQSVMPESASEFTRMLADSYGIGDSDITPLDNEATLAHTLWTGWRQQLATDGYLDTATQLANGYSRSLSHIPIETQIILCGFTDFSLMEISWIKSLMQRQQLTLLLHGQIGGTGYHPDILTTQLVNTLDLTATTEEPKSAYSKFIDNVFTQTQGDLRTRTKSQIDHQPESPAKERLVIYKSQNAELEARAIDLQVRRWRLNGMANIGIITNDRKLARRVRALLERANIRLQDAAGWALSTTSAASALMRWIECIEQNFAIAPFLDLLKSPFFSLEQPRDEFKRLINRFEHDVLLRENISRDLKRYHPALERRGEFLDLNYGAGTTNAIAGLLDKIESAAQPLIKLRHSRRKPAIDFLSALKFGMAGIGLQETCSHDEAGQQLLTELDLMATALGDRQPTMDWREFRAWLQRQLERSRYRPNMRGGGVELMGFEQCRLYRFDAVIIAGAIQEHLPGQPDTTPFFNERVRRQLGLPTLLNKTCRMYYDYRRLLESAPYVMISYQYEREGEPLVVCPWVQRLSAFHQLAYHESLEDPSLIRLTHTPDVQIVVRDSLPLPTIQPNPAVSVPGELVPHTLSASSHQRMIDCPYQFYAADILRLSPLEEQRAELEKVDYGLRVHRILQVFHSRAAMISDPRNRPLQPDTLEAQQRLLIDITDEVFAKDIKDSILARGWLYRWQKLIPEYIRWQQQRSQEWTISGTEVERSRRIETDRPGIELRGRIDRLENGQEGQAVIDYKTGSIPKLDAIIAGEQIQLLFYALLLGDNVQETMILALANDTVSDKLRLDGDCLRKLAQDVEQRLISLQHAIRTGMALPAWGDSLTCKVCAMEGLCRKGFWSSNSTHGVPRRENKKEAVSRPPLIDS